MPVHSRARAQPSRSSTAPGALAQAPLGMENTPHSQMAGRPTGPDHLFPEEERSPFADTVHTRSLDSGQVAKDRFVSQEKVLLSGASGGLAQDRPEGRGLRGVGAGAGRGGAPLGEGCWGQSPERREGGKLQGVPGPADGPSRGGWGLGGEHVALASVRHSVTLLF